MITRINQRHISFLISVALAVTTLVAYEPMRHNGFVNYDDNKYITKNEDIKSGITWQSLSRVFKPHYHMWHPLTTFTNMLDCQLFGLNPFWHHLVSLLFHITNALLLFWLLTNLTGATWASAFVAAVFALHPVQVESVAWASERKTVLSGLFWLLTIAAYIHYTRQPRPGRYVLLLLAFGLCIMTKPAVVTLPCVLLLLDYWPLERVKWGQHTEGRRGTSPGWLIAEKIPLLMLSAILSVITFVAQQRGGVIIELEKIPFDLRVANMFISYIKYIGKMIWPSQLAVFYPHPHTNLSDTTVIICALLFILITVLSIYIGRRRRYVAVGWLWYAGTLIPMIGLVQVGGQAMANRYMYISMLGLLIIVAWAVKDLITNRPRWKAATAVLVTIALLSAIAVTRTQVKYWRNDTTLFEHTLKVTENNEIAENNYGCALLEAGRLNEAMLHFSNALRIKPNYFSARNNAGKVLIRQGKPKEAIACFNALTGYRRHVEDVYSGLGVAYSQLGKYEPAIQNWTKALQLKPNDVGVLNNLAWLLATVDDASIRDANKAIEYAERVCELTKHEEPHFLDTLAAAYAAAGRFDDAKDTAEKALNTAKAANKEDLAHRIESRLQLYQAGQPYRQK